MKLYDEPLRKWLTNKYLIKRKKRNDNNDKIENRDNKNKVIDKKKKKIVKIII